MAYRPSTEYVSGGSLNGLSGNKWATGSPGKGYQTTGAGHGYRGDPGLTGGGGGRFAVQVTNILGRSLSKEACCLGPR